MRIEHFEEFIDISKTLNFTRTAENFYITQPVLSKHMAVLEKELGGRLFERGQRGITLTDFGKAMLPSAIELVNSKEHLMHAARGFLDGENASIKLGYLEHAGRPHLYNIQKRFKELHPSVKISYLGYEQDLALAALDNGAVDIVIAGLTSPLSKATYASVTVYEDTFTMLVKENDPLAELPSICASDLTGRVLVAPNADFMGKIADSLHAWLSPETNNIEIIGNIDDVNTLTLKADMEDAIGPTLGHLKQAYGSKYKFIPLEGFNEKFPIAIVWRKANAKPFFDDLARITREVIQEAGY